MPAEERLPQPLIRRLYLPAYSVAEAARFSHTTTRKLSGWHFRRSQLGPVLPGRERRKPLSYMQLVESSFVATFRDLGVTMPRIRKARDYLIRTFDVEYPFAQLPVRNAGPHIIMDLLETEPDPELGVVVADRDGQLAWANVIEDRFIQFDYIEDIALRWHVAGRDSPVLIDPRISFGSPMIKGVPTRIIRGRNLAGETVADIADDYGIEQSEVLEALRFEGVQLAA